MFTVSRKDIEKKLSPRRIEDLRPADVVTGPDNEKLEIVAINVDSGTLTAVPWRGLGEVGNTALLITADTGRPMWAEAKQYDFKDIKT